MSGLAFQGQELFKMCCCFFFLTEASTAVISWLVIANFFYFGKFKSHWWYIYCLKKTGKKYNVAFTAEGDFFLQVICTQRRACDVPEDASVWPQGYQSSHEVPGQDLAHGIPSRTGAPPVVCGHALAHSNAQRRTFYFASQCRSSRSSSGEKILWHSRCHPVLGKVSSAVAASDVAAGTVPLPRCCTQTFQLCLTNLPSLWQCIWAPNSMIFHFLQRWSDGNLKPALCYQIIVNLSSLLLN